LPFSESSVSGGVEPKAETAGVVGMKAESKNSSEDLPNQEKNQYWTVYWWEIGALYTKEKVGSDQENDEPLRGKWAKTAGMKIWQTVRNDLHCMEGKTNKWQPVWKDFNMQKWKIM